MQRKLRFYRRDLQRLRGDGRSDTGPMGSREVSIDVLAVKTSDEDDRILLEEQTDTIFANPDSVILCATFELLDTVDFVQRSGFFRLRYGFSHAASC